MTTQPLSSKSKVVLVTGANRGIGLGLVRHYLGAGEHVVATARDPQQADELAALHSQHPGQLSIQQLDVTDEQSVAGLVNHLNDLELSPTLLINNAGTCREESFGDWTAEGFQQQFNTNVVGPAIVAQAIAPRMPEGSKLINISSGMGSIEQNLNPAGPYDGYSTSKAALNMLTRRLAVHLEPQGITVVCMDPGWVQTRMGGQGAPTPVREAVTQITTTIANLSLEHTGKYFHSGGAEIPW